MGKSNTVDKPRLSIVVAIGRDGQHNRVIGKDNKLIWHIPEDLKRFKSITMGHPVIMGFKTFESILASLGKPLPGRPNIVLTFDKDWAHEGVIPAYSLEDAIEKAQALDTEEIFIGGGTQTYTQALPLVNRLYLTLIDDEKDGDAYFPAYEDAFTKVISDESGESNGVKYRWVTLERPE